ncbi:MAG: phosphatidate cytidylyltransferase [Saprospiraceae bacterium]|nr:phosphatidate cytidylyltransferase [Saprospiraceae bacterium]
MNELFQRALTALAIGTIIIASILYSKLAYGIVFLAITIISSLEYINITKLNEVSATKKWILVLVNSFVFLLGYGIAMDIVPGKYRIIGIIPMFLLFSTGLFGRSSPDYRLSTTFLAGHVYIGLPLMLCSYIYIHNSDFWPSYIIAILVFVWANDVGAYIIGRAMGRHKMIPKVSPGKTWEGFFGGLGMALIAAAVYNQFSKNLSLVEWFALGAVVSVGSSFGDLIASSLKRTFGVKNSGSILPGHGGFIDRFDGFFIAIVFAFAYLSLLGVINY